MGCRHLGILRRHGQGRRALLRRRTRADRDRLMKNGGLKRDERDLRTLAILQKEGRITKTELAERVNLSPTPCWSRLKRLEKLGLIEGYRAKIALKRFGLTM